MFFGAMFSKVIFLESVFSKAKRFAALVAFGTLAMHGASHSYAEAPGSNVSPEQALTRLEKGNARFAAGKTVHPHATAARIANTAKEGQHPFATIITCSDSRVPVESVFDQGVGDIFVIRVAGNVCDVDEVGSIEYGVDHLETPLMVVLGHTHCGAVTAVVTHAELHGSIPQLVDNIEPAVIKAQKDRPDLHGKELVPLAVKDNVWQSIDDLFRSSPATRERARMGTLKVVGAIYRLSDGKVEWLGIHPEQERLLTYTDGPHETVSPRAKASTASHGETGARDVDVHVASESME